MNQKNFLWASLSGLLLGLSWYMPFQILVFVALVPLLIVEKNFYEQSQKSWKLYGYAFWAFLLWNIGVIWWLFLATKTAAVAAYVANALLQALPVLFFHQLRKRAANRFGLWALVLSWLAFEYLHLNWFLSWSWLNLGNVFADYPFAVQWYEFTGVLGGTAWILVINILIFEAWTNKQKYWKAFAVFFLPLLLSLLMYWNYEFRGESAEILVVQPNIDCYTEKYTYNSRTDQNNSGSYIPYQTQISRMTSLIESHISAQTQAVLLPETALHESIDERRASDDFGISRLNGTMKKFSQSAILAGVNSIVFYEDTQQAQNFSNTYRQGNGLIYDIYNSAYFNDNQNQEDFYHKSKLVIGVETNPFNPIFRYLGDDFMLNFGGAVGNLGIQKDREVFSKNKLVLAPVICYESIFGEYVGEYSQKGANLIAIITNDGWWDDTSGHKQHFAYARLRAVEQRRDVARAANTGISGFINQRGDVLAKIDYNQMSALRHDVRLNNELTFYARYGDVLGRLAAFIFAFMYLAAWIRNKGYLRKRN